MKILQVLSSFGNGGAEKFIIDLSNQLSINHEVTLCSLKKIEKIMIYPSRISKNVNLIALNKNKAIDFIFIFKLFKLILQKKPKIINIHLDAALKYFFPIIFLLKYPKFFYTIHSNLNNEKIILFDNISKYKFIQKKVTFICISRSILLEFKARYSSLEFILIENGINFQDLSSKSNQVFNEIEELKTDSSTKVFTILSNYSPPKNLELIVKAFNRIHDEKQNAILLIIGSDRDPGQREWNKICKMKSENIYMIGIINNIQDYLYFSDAFCLCSTFEGMPISILEAYSQGKPVLSTRVGGIVDILTPEINGFFSEDLTVDSYFFMIKYFLELPEISIKKIKKNNIQLFETRFNIKKTSESYLLNYLN